MLKTENILETYRWTRFNGIEKRQKTMFRLTNQAKLRSFRLAPKHKYRCQVPRDYNHVINLEEKNGNTIWQDNTSLETKQLEKYNPFNDIDKDGIPLKGCNKIKVNLIYDIKQDMRHKARCVADRHLTENPIDNVYSGVVSLQWLRMIIFLTEINQLDIWATYIGNVYLEEKTSEKVYITAGQQFREKWGNTLTIYKSLYGLQSSGVRWHEKFSDDLRNMGFFPCKEEHDIWMRQSNGLWEYITLYVDDLSFVVCDPNTTITLLKEKYKLKGTGSISYYLGCDFFRDDE